MAGLKNTTLTATLAVDMADFNHAMAQAHADLDRLEQRAAGVSKDLLPLVLGAVAALEHTPRRVSRRSLLGLSWRRG
jgi:hypothetical protein